MGNNDNVAAGDGGSLVVVVVVVVAFSAFGVVGALGFSLRAAGLVGTVATVAEKHGWIPQFLACNQLSVTKPICAV